MSSPKLPRIGIMFLHPISQSHYPNLRGTGFTLLELLVAVGSIAVLAALLFPWAKRGAEAAIAAIGGIKQKNMFWNY